MIPKRFSRPLSLAAAVSVAFIGASSVGGTAHAMPSPLLLPMVGNYTWYVCQGYNTPEIDHTFSSGHNAYYAVDLVPSANSSGSYGCTNNPNAATNIPLVAPATGTVTQVGPDMVCITFDAGGSMLIGHITGRPNAGTHVSAGYRIGAVEPPVNNGWQGNFAHVHLQAYSGGGCGWAQNVPLDYASGFHIQGMRDLPPQDGIVHTYPDGSGPQHEYQGQIVRLPGDANGDGKVDLTDLSLLSSAWGQTGPPNFSSADFNGDGHVDLTDFSILGSHWGQQGW